MLFLLSVLILILTANAHVSLEINQRTQVEIENFIFDSKLWISSTFSQTTLLTTDNSKEASDVVRTIIRTVQLPTVVLAGEYFTVDHDNIETTLAIILTKDKDNIDILLQNILSSTSYKVKVPVILIICKRVTDDEFNIKRLLQHIWSFGLTRYILVYVTHEIHANTYNPFTRTVLNISRTEDAVIPNFLRNLNGWTLRVSLFEEWPLLKKESKWFSRTKWLGRDYAILRVVTKILNATYRIIEPPKNTRIEGAIRDMIRGKTDFCFVRQFQSSIYENIETSEYNEVVSLNLLVPKPKQLTQNEAFFKIFQPEIWFSIFFCLFLLIVMLKLVVNYFYHSLRWSQKEIPMDLWGILLNLAIRNIKKYDRILKIPIIIWVWACLILYVSFQCRLIDLMQSPFYDKGISSFEDLEKSNIPIYSSHNYTEIMGNASLFHKQYRSINQSDLHDLVWKNDGDVAYAMPFALIQGHINPNIFPVNHSPSHIILEDPLSHSFAVYLFPANSPYTHTISKALLSQRQYGFSKKLTRMSVHIDMHRISEVRVLSMHHLQTGFLLLSVGYLLSFSAWFIELHIYPSK